MKQRFVVVLMSAVIFGNIFCGSSQAAELPAMGIAGYRAPELISGEWIDTNGNAMKPVRLKDYKGKVVYIFCWQSFCPGCHSRGFPAYKKISDAFQGDTRIAIFAVQTVFEGFGINTKSKLKVMNKRYKLNTILGHDVGLPGAKHGSSLLQRYRSGGTPWHIIISKSGYVIYNGFNIDPDMAVRALKQIVQEVPAAR